MTRLSTLSIAIAATLTAVSVSPVKAQERDLAAGDFYIGARAGVGYLDSDRIPVTNNEFLIYESGTELFVAGVESGMFFTDEIEVRVYFEDLQADIDNSGLTAYGDSYGVDALYNFENGIYAGVGINRTELPGAETQMYRGTVGYRTFLSDNLAFRAEAAMQQSEGNFTDVLANIGLQYFFGRSAAEQPQAKPAPARPAPQPAAAAPVDSDNDGVIDANDKCPNTPNNYSVDEEGCIVYENETVTQELLVEFAINSSLINDSFDDNIKDTADFMKEHPQLDVIIEGHTDYTGEADYNHWLSERRAQAVGERLINNYGIAEERVSTVGYGESRPKVEGTSAEARQQNRRIEAKLSVTNRVPVED